MANPYLGADNPYITAKVDQAQGDLARNWNLTAQPAFNSAMVNSGSFGNANLQAMNEAGQQGLQRAMGDISTNLRGQDYRDQQSMYQWDQGFDRGLYNDAFAQNQQQFQNGMGLLGMMGGANSADLASATNQQNAPLNYWQQFSQGANSLGQGYGTQVQGTTSSPLTAALGGAQLGNAFSGMFNGNGTPYNAGTDSGGWGSKTSGLGSFFYGNGGSGS